MRPLPPTHDAPPRCPRGAPRARRLACATAAALLLATACAPHPHEETPTHRLGGPNEVVLAGHSLDFVRVEPAREATDVHARVLVGRVAFDERHLATVGPPVQGRVATVNVVTGDHVARGAVLLTIHAPEVAAANAQVLESRAALLLAERAAERARTLVAQNAGSAAEMQQAQAALEQARSEAARANAARAALGGARAGGDYQLVAPIAGTVVERNVAVGVEVHADQDQPLLTVADLATVWVIADVYERDLPLVHAGDEALVHVAAQPNRAFAGRITYVGDTVDPQTRVTRARIELPNADQVLRPGMYASVEVRGRPEGSAEVPITAVVARRDQFYVFVESAAGHFVEREVRPGPQHGEQVTVLAGLHPGDRVVVRNAILLDAELHESL